MDLSLTERQVMLQTMVGDLMRQELPKERVLEIDDSETGFAPDLWQQMAELGLAGMIIPDEYGGAKASFTDLGVVYEVLGEAACSSPHLSSAVLSALAILEAGDAAQRRALLPAIAEGAQIHENTPVTRISRDSDTWVIEAGNHRLRARHLLLATNAYHREVKGAAAERIWKVE